MKVYHNEKEANHAILLRPREGAHFETDETNRAYDPLHFVLMFPCGDDGWQPRMQRQEREEQQDGMKLWDSIACRII